MSIRIDGDPDALEFVPIFDGDREVGLVSMAVPSPQLGGATLAMARLHRDVVKPGTTLTVKDSNGVARSAEVMSTPVYDPERVRVRS